MLITNLLWVPTTNCINMYDHVSLVHCNLIDTSLASFVTTSLTPNLKAVKSQVLPMKFHTQFLRHPIGPVLKHSAAAACRCASAGRWAAEGSLEVWKTGEPSQTIQNPMGGETWKCSFGAVAVSVDRFHSMFIGIPYPNLWFIINITMVL